MKRKHTGRALRLLEGGAAAAAASAPPPPPAPKIDEAKRIADRQELIDRHRGQRSELQARQARETAELIARHIDEERDQEAQQRHDLAKLWRRQGREPSGFLVRQLGPG